MDKAKILDKIKKCLALGKSPNEHEAAAAMRQAQKLMERNGITEKDLGTIGYAMEVVQTSIQAGKKVPVTLSAIVRLLMHAFGVRATYGRTILVSDANYKVTYWGPEHRVMLAGYAHAVVARAVEAAWKRHLAEHPGSKGVVGGRAGFYTGWILRVTDSVDEFGMTGEESDATQLLLGNHYGAELKNAEVTQTKLMRGTLSAGFKAGESFKLHRPINGVERLKLEN
jgi:hypothetical protein